MLGSEREGGCVASVRSIRNLKTNWRSYGALSRGWTGHDYLQMRILGAITEFARTLSLIDDPTITTSSTTAGREVM